MNRGQALSLSRFLRTLESVYKSLRETDPKTWKEERKGKKKRKSYICLRREKEKQEAVTKLAVDSISGGMGNRST